MQEVGFENKDNSLCRPHGAHVQAMGCGTVVD